MYDLMYDTAFQATMTVANKLASCLVSTTCMCMGANVIGKYEGSGEGVSWSNMYSNHTF